MKKGTLRHSLLFVLTTVLAFVAIGVSFSIKASATYTRIDGRYQIFENKIKGGTVKTKTGTIMRSWGASPINAGAIYNSVYNFNTEDPQEHHAYAYDSRDSTAMNDAFLETGSFNFGNSSGFIVPSNHDLFTVVEDSDSFWVETVSPTKHNFMYKATLEKGGALLDYEVVTTVDDRGEIRHDAKLTNRATGSVVLPGNEPILVFLDMSLDAQDSIPLSVGPKSKTGLPTAYMYKVNTTTYEPLEPRLRFDMISNSGLSKMFIANRDHFNYYNPDISNGTTEISNVPADTPLSTWPNHEVMGPGAMPRHGDSAVVYEVANSAGLEPGQTVEFSYSEKLSLAGSKLYYTDEAGNPIFVENAQNDEYAPGEEFSITPPRAPGYRYSHATATWDTPTNPDKDKKPAAILGDDPDNLMSRTSSDPVKGIAPAVSGENFRINLVYRAVNNKDADPQGDKDNSTNNNQNNNNDTNNNNTTNPETDQSTGNTIQVPSTAAKKGEALYAVNKVGLYKSVNFSKASRIKGYAKQTRVKRPEFIVKGYAYTKNGTLRYLVQQYNPYKNKYVAGTKGYITANRKFVEPAYYETTGTKRVKVINTTGVRAYSNQQLSNYKKHYKKGATLKVKKVVKQKNTTRLQLTNGLYVTGNKKFIIFR